MSKDPTVYLCDNTACTLGGGGQTGRFTGGITKEQVTMLTGNQEPKNYGEGFCPNCGVKATREAPTPEQEHKAHLEAEIARLKEALKEAK